MNPSRKQFLVPMPPSDRQLWAIGLVVVQWSHFEILIHTTATGLLKTDPPAQEKFSQTRSMKIRLDLLRSAVESQMAQQYQQQFLPLITEGRSCQQMRDRIVHGMWHGEIAAPSDAPLAIGALNWLQPRPKFEWKLDFGGIKSVALRIDKLIHNWVQAILADAPVGQDILMSDALQHKLRK